MFSHSVHGLCNGLCNWKLAFDSWRNLRHFSFFIPSRSALRSTELPIQWLPRTLPGVNRLTFRLNVMLMSKMCGAVPFCLQTSFRKSVSFSINNVVTCYFHLFLFSLCSFISSGLTFTGGYQPARSGPPRAASLLQRPQEFLQHCSKLSLLTILR